MRKLSFDKKFKKEFKKPEVRNFDIKKLSKKQKLVNVFENGGAENISSWNFIYIFAFFFILFSVLFISLAKLQIVDGSEMASRSQSNRV